MRPTIPVTVITGFLGAGKSTLLDTWLEQLPRDETAVIINEQGDIGIDGALLAERAGTIREITGGCVCCVTQAALDAALLELAESTPTPTRIVVETSGAASPAGVIRPVTRGSACEQLVLDGVITVLDAARAERTMEFELTIEQLGFADVVVMSHVDECEETELRSLERTLLAHAPAAVIARACHGRLQDSGVRSLLELLASRDEILHVLPATDANSSRHGMEATSLVHEGELDEEHFAEWVEESLGSVESRIMRIKGILALPGVDERVVVQGVGDAITITLGRAWGDTRRTSRLVIVSLGIGIDVATLRAGFAACAIGRSG